MDLLVYFHQIISIERMCPDRRKPTLQNRLFHRLPSNQSIDRADSGPTGRYRCTMGQHLLIVRCQSGERLSENVFSRNKIIAYNFPSEWRKTKETRRAQENTSATMLTSPNIYIYSESPLSHHIL